MDETGALAVLRAAPAGNGRLAAVAARVTALAGWRRRGLLAGMGALAALALPPLHLVPLLLLAFPALIWAWDGSASHRARFGAGWWWGLGFYTVGFYWIANALLTDPVRFGWMIPFATMGLGGLMACFIGLATLLAGLARFRGPGRVLLLAAAWVLGEWLRTFVLTGFPWNPIGSVWDVALPVLQVGALTGIHGLSLMTVLVFTLPALAVDAALGARRWVALAVAVVLPLAAWTWGSVRLASYPDEMVPGVRLRLVQPATPQELKWREDQRLATLNGLVALSRGPGVEAVTDVIWPETAAPFFLDLDAGARAIADQAAPPGGLLITGAPRATPQGVEPFQIWNSLEAFDQAGRLWGVYDKVHLVPFGEYVPLRGVLPLAKITAGATDFSAGPGHRTLDLPGLPPVSPLICYEALFPGGVVGRDQPSPQWLLNVTNDGWFGQSAGPYQHLAAARMRAVEQGLPLARAANTGISAVFDGLGREIAKLPLGVRGVVDSPLPRAMDGLTPYARWGDAIPFALVVLVVLLGVRFREGGASSSARDWK